MIIKEKSGNLNSYTTSKTIDWVELQWYETNKRILHKKSKSGKDIVMKFLNEAPLLTDGDILWQDEENIIVVEIQPCEAIIIKPSTMQQMAAVCYEIGNKHLPLFQDKEELLVPFEAPLFRLLSTAGYNPERQNRKLVNALKTTVLPHSNAENKQSLFSKILQLTASSSDV